MAPDCDGTRCHCATHIQYCSTPFIFTTLGVLFDYVVKLNAETIATDVAFDIIAADFPLSAS